MEETRHRNLPPTLRNSKCVFQGVRFDVHALELMSRSGKFMRKEAVVFPGAVVILPIYDQHHVVFIRNERFCVGETLWELPAGTLEPEEQPIETAKRELIEEAGYKANSIEPLLQFYPSPGICTEKMHAFVARNLEHVGQKLEETEKITVEILSWERIMTMLKNGIIRDGKTISTLLFYREKYREY